MEKRELAQVIRVGLEKMQAVLKHQKDDALPLFEVRPISNGYLVCYNDVEQYEVKVPTYHPVGPRHPGPPPGMPAAPTMETKQRFRLKRAEVFCSDAAAIKVAVDEALKLEEKVKLLVAENILSDDTDFAVAPGSEMF